MSDLALLAGIVASDGHLERDAHGVKVITTSKPFLDEVVLPLLRRVTGKTPSLYFGKTGFSNSLKYIAYVYDSKLSRELSNVYAIPLGKKAETISPPENLSDEEIISYVQGWFAGEGSVSRDVHVKNSHKYYWPQVMLWVKNKSIAEWLWRKLNRLEIYAKLFASKKNGQYLVIIREKKSLLAFAEKINFIHPEKQAKFSTVLWKPQNQNVARQFGGIS